MVVPDAECEHHAVVEGVTHGLKTTLSSEVVGVAELGLLLFAVILGDGVDGGDARDVNVGVLDDFAILDIDAADLRESAVGGTVCGDKLGYDGDLRLGVDSAGGAEEARRSHTVRVEITSVLVANPIVSVRSITTLSATTAGLALGRADMRSVSGSIEVCLPNVHLRAARAVLARASVDVIRRGVPA